MKRREIRVVALKLANSGQTETSDMKILSLLAALLCLAWPARAVPITVRVLGPDGQPSAAAKLSVPKWATDKAAASSREIAGENGVFRFDWDAHFPKPGSKVEPKLEDLPIVRVEAPGMMTDARFLLADETTVKLEPGHVWSGTVFDREQRPVAGVTVRMTDWSNSQDTVTRNAFGLGDMMPDWAKTAMTDAGGRWQMDGLPAQGAATVRLQDPRFVGATYNLKVLDGAAPPLFVERAATISGQMLAPNGAPIADAPVVAGDDYENVARTDARGRFTLSGIKPGTLRLVSFDPLHPQRNLSTRDLDYLVVPLEKVVARAGATTDVGAWKMPRGAEVTMRALDAATGKPIVGATFGTWTGSSDSRPSDAQGRIRARVLPGLDLSGPELGNVYADNYVSARVPRPPALSKVGATDAGTIRLQRGSLIKGRARISGLSVEASHDLPQLALGEINQFHPLFPNGNDNSFQTETLAPGTYKVQALAGGMPSKTWRIVSPATVTVPATGALAPIEIIVKRLTPAPAPLPQIREVRGQLLDAQSAGVAGAVVRVAVPYKMFYGEVLAQASAVVIAVTDRDGKWSAFVGVSPISAKILSVDRPGYVSVGEARSETKSDIITLNGISLRARGAVFAGRVLDADGQPAAHAWVAALEARDFEPVQTNADGTFALRDVPVERFTLLAAQGVDFARMPAVNGDANGAAKVELRLQAPPAFDREALVKQALDGPLAEGPIFDHWDELGAARMESLMPAADWGDAFAHELARRDPIAFVRRAPDWIQNATGEARAVLEAELALARAASGDDEEKIAARNWVDDQNAVKRQIEPESVTALLRVAAVAHRLGRTDAAQLSDYAAAIAAQLSGGANANAETWGALAALSGRAATENLAEGLQPIAELKMWGAATGELARAGDLAGAQAAVARMALLAATPAWVQHTKAQSWDDPASIIDLVRLDVVRALAPTDLAGASAMAADIGEDFKANSAQIAVAEAAIAKGEMDIAQTNLRAAMTGNYGNPEQFALAASVAQKVGPEFGAELWAQAYARTTRQSEDFSPSVALWAFYRARVDPAQSRVLVEREWNWRLPALAKAPADRQSTGDLDALEMAMSAVDPARALEMRAQATRQLKIKAPANLGLAAALLRE